MGKGGAPAPPDPMIAIRAQQKAQEEARIKLEKERSADADSFLSSNAINDDFRSNIFGRSNEARDVQMAGLNSSVDSILQDIRQRNAGRGLGQSSSGSGMLGQAEYFGEQSRQDLFDSARRRAEQRIADQQMFLDDAASSIRAGASPASAQARFRTDMTAANTDFENALSKAKSGDQRNAAFQGFEKNRQLAATRFKESVNQFGSQSAIASAFTPQTQKTKEPTGQLSGGFTGSLS